MGVTVRQKDFRRVLLDLLRVGYIARSGADHRGSLFTRFTEVTRRKFLRQVCSRATPLLRFCGKLLFYL
jgi:hypothetical protein